MEAKELAGTAKEPKKGRMPYRGHVENGVVVLDEPAELQEGTVVTVAPVLAQADDILELATQVYSGLSPEEIAEIERIALDRRDFFEGK